MPAFPALLACVAVLSIGLSCGSVSTLSDAGASGAAGTSAGSGRGGTTGAGGVAGTTGAGGVAGTTGAGGAAGARLDGGADGGPIACQVDLNDCPTGFTCACGGGAGPGPGTCTCHKNCTDVSACPMAEPLCGCPSTVGGARFCVNACFCSCQ